MSGYREHSFDPNAYEQPGPALKPYNWVQWTGVGIASVGGLLIALYLLGKIGILPDRIEPAPAPFMLMLLGVTIVNSRRAPGTQVSDDQREKNRKMLVAVALICAAILGAAAAIDLNGVL